MEFRIKFTEEQVMDLKSTLRKAKRNSRNEYATVAILDLIETIDGQVHKQIADRLAKR